MGFLFLWPVWSHGPQTFQAVAIALGYYQDLGFPAEPITKYTIHLSQKTWRNHTTSDLEALSLLASFHSARR